MQLGLKLAGDSAVAAALVQIIQLLLASAHAARAGGVIARTAFRLNRIFGKNQELTGWERNGAPLVVLP